MKRLGIILMTALLTIPAMAGIGVAGPRQQRQLQRQEAKAQQLTPEQQQNRVQQLIADVYVNRFQNGVGLSDEQFLKVGTFIRQFIQMRFRIANQRNTLNQRRTQLLEQPDPSETEVRQLSDDTAQFERTVGNMESVFLSKIQAELTPRQILMVPTFNKRFFEEDLPKLIETARAEFAARGQAPPVRPNANAARNTKSNAQAPADAFRGGKK